ncbi:MAG: hypothetical protein AAF740_10305 [Bacteroidota bacterium]
MMINLLSVLYGQRAYEAQNYYQSRAPRLRKWKEARNEKRRPKLRKRSKAARKSRKINARNRKK